MGKVVRFGVSMEKDLLEDFDKLIERKGYSSRSEALRDLLRNALISEVKLDPKANILATVSILYKHSEHHLSDVLTDMQHKNHSIVISTTHVHLDCDNCLEVVILKGTTPKVKELSESLISVKGVRHGGVVYSAK